MEALGAVSSIMAVVSLTLQLAGAVETTKLFWESVKTAPQEVQRILGDLDLLRGILDGIRASVVLRCPGPPDPAKEIAIKGIFGALVQCQEHIGKMTGFATAVEKRFERGHSFTALKTALQKDKIADFRENLEQAKTTLLLAVNVATFLLQESCSERVLQEFSQLRSEIKMEFSVRSMLPSSGQKPSSFGSLSKAFKKSSRVIRSNFHEVSASDILLWLLQLPQDSPYRKYLQATGSLIGKFSWRSTEKIVMHDSGTDYYESSSIVTIYLPILRRAVSVQSERAMGQWTHTFRVVRIVPENSAIFKLCAKEDESSLRRLFDAGVASPFDQTASGITLLHVAAASYNCESYKFLQECGVEYSFCKHPKYGNLAPVEVTQSTTIFAEGRYQTVQEWLGINNDESRIIHPEINYSKVVQIWNSLSTETIEAMTDDQIIILLQGPLSLPRQRTILLQEQKSIETTPASRHCSSLLLLCYYFLFHSDPCGYKITCATIQSSALKESLPIFEYLSQYWSREQWLEMLSQCCGLDFYGLGYRQEEKYNGFTYSKVFSDERGKWLKKKNVSLKFGKEDEIGMFIGHLEEFVANFEFEMECEDEPPAYQCNEYEEKTWTNQSHKLSIIEKWSYELWALKLLIFFALLYYYCLFI